jgi:aminoglycoside phosphotransferase (APT) family kinase protein
MGGESFTHQLAVSSQVSWDDQLRPLASGRPSQMIAQAAPASPSLAGRPIRPRRRDEMRLREQTSKRDASPAVGDGAGDLPERLLEATRRALAGLERPHDDLELRPTPIESAQARIYLLARGGHDVYVAKVVGGPDAAAAQYRALETCHGWWSGEDAHAVVRPRALLADCDALLLDYLPGRNLAEVIGSSGLGATGATAPTRAAGDFLRRFHRHATVGAAEIQLQDLVEEIMASQLSCLAPLGLTLPAAARRALDAVAPRRVTARRVLLHGDYAPRNLIVTGPRAVAMIDPVLQDLGPPENDVAAFLALVGSASVFASGVAVPAIRKGRLALESAFLDGYGREALSPAICSLRLIDELIWRWASRRARPLEGAAGLLSGLRAAIIDAQMAALIQEAAGALARPWAVRAWRAPAGGPPPPATPSGT